MTRNGDRANVYLPDRLASGVILSHPEFNMTDYTSEIDAKLIIRGLNSQYTLTVTFEFFDFYYNDKYTNCHSDWLQFIGILAPDWKMKFCGFPPSTPTLGAIYRFSVAGEEISFRFRTNDQQTHGKGFKFKFNLSEF